MLSLLLAGCFPTKVIDSNRTGECYKTQKEMTIWKKSSPNFFVGEFIIHTRPEMFPGGESSLVEVLPVGTKVKLEEFLQGSSGTYNYFVRVKFQLLSGENIGLIADVPSCVPNHPYPRWVSECSLDPNQIVFDSSIIQDCN